MLARNTNELKKGTKQLYCLCSGVIILLFVLCLCEASAYLSIKNSTSKYNELAQETLNLSEENENLKEYISWLECHASTEFTINKYEDDYAMEMAIIEPIKARDKKEYLVLWKGVRERYENKIDLEDDIYDTYTIAEVSLMAKCVETECYGLPFENKVDVASVILNRLGDEKFSNDVTEVITGENQFAYWREVVTEDSILALEYAYSIENTRPNAIGFRSDKCVQGWNGWNYIEGSWDGAHWFFTREKI